MSLVRLIHWRALWQGHTANLTEEDMESAVGNFHGIRSNQVQRGRQCQKRQGWICEGLHKMQNIPGCMESSLHLCNTEDVEFLVSLRRSEHRGGTELSPSPIRVYVWWLKVMLLGNSFWTPYPRVNNAGPCKKSGGEHLNKCPKDCQSNDVTVLCCPFCANRRNHRQFGQKGLEEVIWSIPHTEVGSSVSKRGWINSPALQEETQR